MVRPFSWALSVEPDLPKSQVRGRRRRRDRKGRRGRRERLNSNIFDSLPSVKDAARNELRLMPIAQSGQGCKSVWGLYL